uniref:Predicted AAA-ATPase n=1 Tax=Candidatus Kentrum sp. SD TaxID=2126332 RepID=A0A450YLK1_9GAMM|nr:MAG: Predicted AAA-ATPase [Candidatus Kentron sp. SD]VFK42378.1 MAG: Predicted AAA-ATPase [Candidatus Kentron sp. SD]VFK79438.1 MAG: Predicted AAA-ATPase [Candidatus Kentron sp. SD]
MLGYTYTQAELESDFPGHLQGAALEFALPLPEPLVRIRDWYNGYRFHPRAERVYNPFSCLLYLQKKEFKPWWFETETPTFLIDLIRNAARPVAELESGIWIFELKLDGAAEAAIAQIREKDYARPYRASGRPVYLVGINFDSEKRNVGEWKMEMLETTVSTKTSEASPRTCDA